MKNTEKTMDQIVALCKGRGFVYPGSEIYGGLANSWDYGPLGVELKNNVKRVLDGIRDGSLQYDFVEFMACPGGCINGGGQPIQHANVRNFTDIKALRAAALYRQDEGMTYRRSHENPVVQKVYADFLGEPGSHKAHALLHCSYIKQKRYRV